MKPCEKLHAEWIKAMKEWEHWDKRSRLPASISPVEEQKEPVATSPDLLENLRMAKKKATEAESRMKKAEKAYLECMKK